MMDDQKRIAEFFESDAPFVEFSVECPLEKRIGFVTHTIQPHLSRMRLIVNFCIAKIAEFIPTSSVKIAFYRAMGVTIGTGVYISPDVMIDPHFPGLITLDDYCVLGWGSVIFTHEMSTRKYRIGRVRIGRGSVVGAFSVIRAGVTLGDDAQTPMNSFIYKDVPAHDPGRTESVS